ncbi:MAG: NUDIX domain-containing protein [Candidatus Omnitrophica bacterium]|nr:NUDIX domain-containing protein [Candidatus Omnitrophota bacterium]
MHVFAAGCVLFRKSKRGLAIAVIKKRKTGHWSLPKGKLNQYEATKEAALRELGEETGVSGEIIRRIGLIHYRYKEPQERRLLYKHVVFYLTAFKKGVLRPGLPEVTQVRWVPIGEAPRILSYELEKEIVIQAQGVLSCRAFSQSTKG